MLGQLEATFPYTLFVITHSLSLNYSIAPKVDGEGARGDRLRGRGIQSRLGLRISLITYYTTRTTKWFVKIKCRVFEAERVIRLGSMNCTTP